jgi:hypothetical protein
MDSSFDLLPPLHPPGRSRTVSAWSALISLLLLVTFGFFYSFILQESISALLWASRPFTGITIHAETLPVRLGEPLRWKNVVMTSGLTPHQSRLEFQAFSLELTSPWRMIFGDHLLVQKLGASAGKGLLDFRHESSSSTSSFLEQQGERLRTLFQQKMMALPPFIMLQDLSLLCITEKERCSIDHFSCSLPQKEPGNISYKSLFFEVGGIKCDLPQTNCDAFWDGKTITVKNLLLDEEMSLRHLELTPYPDRLEFGFAATLFNGLLRADGCLRKNDPVPTLDVAVLAEQLPIERLSKFLGLQKKVSGTLREGRLIFRGSPRHPIDAEASLRMLVDHLRLKKKEWASLSVASNLIGRKISVTEFQLKQQENRVSLVGEMSLPEDWHHIGEAPFHCKLKATIADASQLTDVIGAPWNEVTGKIFMDGDVTGGANRAEGYLHLQGTEMSLYGLPIDVIESTVLFQGEKTNLSHLDLWNGNNHLELSGIMANSWPHDYEAEGSINYRHFFEKWTSLEKWTDRDASGSTTSMQNREHKQSLLRDLVIGLYKQGLLSKNSGDGLLQVHWKGHGTATTHEGSFDVGLDDAVAKNQPRQLQCIGSYTPDLITCPTVKMHLGEKTFSTSLSLSSHTMNLSKVTFQENQHALLSGTITLPLDGMGLLRGDPLSSLLEWTTPMEVNLALHEFPLDNIAPFMGLPHQGTLIDGTIQSSGLWSEPALDIVLDGKTTNSKNLYSHSTETLNIGSKKKDSFHLQLSSTKGEGHIDASLQNKNETRMKLQGTLPLGLIRHEEGAPLKAEDQLSLAPARGVFHLVLTLSNAPLDCVATHLLPHEMSLQNATITGEVGLQGTVAAPEFSGHLSVQAEECTLGSVWPALEELNAIISLSKEKITLEHGSAFLGTGKLEVSGSSTRSLGQLHHEYQMAGKDLVLYQQGKTLLQGAAALVLQGDSSGGKLTGNLNITELEWKPQLTILPFLLPPGVLFNSVAIPSSEIPAWTTDLTFHDVPPQKALSPSASPSMRNTTKNTSIEKIDLHLLGPLLSPAPEGTVTFSHLSLQSPQGAMHFLQGAMNFSALQPWQPHVEFTAATKVGPYNITTHLTEPSERHEVTGTEVTSLFFESTPFLSQDTAALLLATPSHHFSSATLSAGWIAQLPFWIRQQEILEPTTIAEPAASFSTTPQLSEYLGFGGSGVFYNMELK